MFRIHFIDEETKILTLKNKKKPPEGSFICIIKFIYYFNQKGEY